MSKDKLTFNNKFNHDDPLDSLGAVYESMYERVTESLHKASEQTAPKLMEWITEAKNKAVELDELTEEDAKELTDWLKRDFNDMAHYLSETNGEVKEWLGFEANLLKNTLIQNLLETADKTTLQLLRMKEDAHQPSSYHTGELTGPGSLICDECQEILQFNKTGRIPACPKCSSTQYHRISIN